jgi:tetrahydromethanopterin S-methyltransferase subunit G
MGAMTTPLALAERVTALEYAVFKELPATMAAMNHGATHLYAETVANGEAIAGLRFDMAAFQRSLHRDVSGLKAALDLQGDSLRKELGVATAEFRAEVTELRDTMSERFQEVDVQFNAVRAEMDQRFGAVDQRFDSVDQRFEAVDQRFDSVDQRFDSVDQRFGAVDRRFDTMDQRFDTVDVKLDALIAEIRANRN